MNDVRFMVSHLLPCQVLQCPKSTHSAPRIVGLDDFAWKKGDRYRTVLIDQEAHKVVDILPDREAETVAKWFADHPGVQVISRDRAGAYAARAANC